MEEKYPESELTYKIIGTAFYVFNKLGPGFLEKVYQASIEKKFIDQKIKFKRELYCNLLFENSKVGRFFIDFLVDDKVVLEIKARDEIYKKDIAQTLAYMKLKNIKVGLIIAFSNKGVLSKRLVN